MKELVVSFNYQYVETAKVVVLVMVICSITKTTLLYIYLVIVTYCSEIAVLDYTFSLSTFDLYTMLKA